MSTVIGFDVYGTLIDTHGVVVALEPFLHERAVQFSRHWREKQLEYSFRRGLMRNYEKFSVCTSQSLDYVCAAFKLSLGEQDKAGLLQAYLTLPAFSDVLPALIEAKAAGFRLYAFTNGSPDSVEPLLVHAGIREFFIGVVSVDDIQSFKPDPDAYRHFLRKAGASKSPAWLVSSNPFDVIGAAMCEMQTAWVQRSPESLFDPWGVEPTITVNSLTTLTESIKRINPAH
jgi:2-haloacid dehalogenase